MKTKQPHINSGPVQLFFEPLKREFMTETVDNGHFSFVGLSEENKAKIMNPVRGNVLVVLYKDDHLGPFLGVVPVESVTLLEQQGRRLFLNTKDDNGVKVRQEIHDFKWVYDLNPSKG